MWMLYVASFLAMFGVVFLKGFQQKNVIGGHRKSAFLTSYAIAFFEVAIVMLIVKGGWAITLSSGTGGGLGIVCAMTFHDKIFNKKA